MRTFIIITLSIVATALIAPGLLSSILGGLLAITVSGLLGLLTVGLVMLIVGVVFGSTLLAFLAGGLTLVIVGFSVFWPLILIFLLVWLCCRSNNRQAA